MINQLAQEVYANAKSKGFHDAKRSVGEPLMLIVSELGEAMEADRRGRHADLPAFEERLTALVNSIPTHREVVDNRQTKEQIEVEIFQDLFKSKIKDTVSDELADAFIRILDFAVEFGIDLEKHVELKMKYNSMREYRHGKKY